MLESVKKIPAWVWIGSILVFAFSGNKKAKEFHVKGRIFSDLVSDSFNARVTEIAKKLAKNPQDEQEVINLSNWMMANMFRESHLNPMSHANYEPYTDENGEEKFKWHYGLTDYSSINKYTKSGGLVGFMVDTAVELWKKKGINYLNKQDALYDLLDLSREEQLDFVEMLLLPYAKRINDLVDMRVILFAPKYFGKGNVVLYNEKDNPKAYKGNQHADADKDGNITVEEVGKLIYKTYNDGIERLKKAKKQNV